MHITSGFVEGCILEPDFWNASYDGFLRLRLPEEAQLVGYADEVAALVTGRSVKQVQLKLGTAMRQLSERMTSRGLTLALEQTEVVVLTKKQIPRVLPLVVGDTSVESKNAIKYLGLIIDSKMSILQQIIEAANKA